MFGWDKIGSAGLVACRGQQMGLTSCLNGLQILDVFTTGL